MTNTFQQDSPVATDVRSMQTQEAECHPYL